MRRIKSISHSTRMNNSTGLQSWPGPNYVSYSLVQYSSKGTWSTWHSFVTLVYNTDDTLPINPRQENLASTLDALVIHMGTREWEKKNKIIKNPCSWGWVFRNPLVCKITSSKVNDMLFYLLASITKKQAQHLTSPLLFWRQHLPYLAFLFWFIHWVTQKSIHFEKNWEQERILKQSEAVIPDTSSSPA